MRQAMREPLEIQPIPQRQIRPHRQGKDHQLGDGKPKTLGHAQPDGPTRHAQQRIEVGGMQRPEEKQSGRSQDDAEPQCGQRQPHQMAAQLPCQLVAGSRLAAFAPQGQKRGAGRHVDGQ